MAPTTGNYPWNNRKGWGILIGCFFLAACGGLKPPSPKPLSSIPGYPLTADARWSIRTPTSRRHTRWEGCWVTPKHAFMAWYGPFGQVLSEAWLEDETVVWLTPRDKVGWLWTNDAKGWQTVVGLPLEGGDLLKWLRGQWSPPGPPDSSKAIPVNGLQWIETKGRYMNFSWMIRTYPDHRMERQMWKTPWSPVITFEYRYTPAHKEPYQVVWSWESEPTHHRTWIRWDGITWQTLVCTIPKQPDTGTGWEMHATTDWFTGADPLIRRFFATN